ncbi:hypothetical protein HDV01_002371 [Terramyces sp. JEL0728]|nr:hypothetical protein HDV01_002371 [Terramyces sp. JEL0728]
MEELPFDILECKIIYYLQGLDIFNLSLTSKANYRRLYPIQIFSKCRVKPECIWPILQPDSLKSFQYDPQIEQLSNYKWRFTQIDISITTLLLIQQYLPRTDLLRIKISHGQPSEYIELSSALMNIRAQKIQLNGLFHNMEYLELFNQPNIIDLCVGMKTNMQLYERNLTLYKNFVTVSSITKLSIMHNDLMDDFVAEMKSAIINSRIQYLNLSGNFIQDSGARDIAEIIIKSQVTALDLSFNPISKPGIQTVLASLPQSKLTELYLGEHLLDDVSLSLEYLAKSQLQVFHFENELSIESQQSINRVISKTKIKDLKLWIRTRLFNEFLQQCVNSTIETVSLGFVFSNEDAFILSQHLYNLPFKSITIERSEIEDQHPLFQSLANSRITQIYGFCVDFASVKDLIPHTNLEYIEIWDALTEEMCEVFEQSRIRTVVFKGPLGSKEYASMFQTYQNSKLARLIITSECDNRVRRMARLCSKEIVFDY